MEQTRKSRQDISAGLCFVLDALSAAFLAAILVSIAVGGIAFEVAGVRVRLTSLTNPTLYSALAITIRYFLRRDLPFLRIKALRFDALAHWGGTAAVNLERSVTKAMAWKLVGAISVIAVVAKLAGAWFLPGFFSGDDVEIHEMTLSVLYGWDLPIWNLRNPFFPLGFVFPSQWFVASLEISDPHTLVFAGRSVVALLSTLTIVLTWFACRRLEPGFPAVALLAALFVAANKLQISFGSSELPRPVSTVFVLGAFILLLSHRPSRTLFAGTLIGLATAFRFSEVVFALPAALMLAWQKRWRDAALMSIGLLVTVGTVIGISDYLYWGTPFSSLWNAVDYTLIDRASSRGYESLLAYIILVPQWTNWIIFLLALIGSSHCRTLALWILVPIATLSLLPHKETRYLIPVVPYICIGAAIGLLRVAQFVVGGPSTRRTEAIAALLPPFLILGLLQDIAGWRLRRSNEEVRLAQWLRAQGPGGIAVRHTWRVGGSVYLSAHRPLIDIDDRRFETADGRWEMFKDVRWIVVDPSTAQRLSEREIQGLGFHFVRSWGEQLRIYSKDSR